MPVRLHVVKRQQPAIPMPEQSPFGVSLPKVLQPPPSHAPQDKVYRPSLAVRDTRPDPMGDASRLVLQKAKPTKADIHEAWKEMLGPINLVPYYSDAWWPFWQRHKALWEAGEAGKVEAARSLIKQIWKAYAQIMKTGKWDKARWGIDEPS